MYIRRIQENNCRFSVEFYVKRKSINLMMTDTDSSIHDIKKSRYM